MALFAFDANGVGTPSLTRCSLGFAADATPDGAIWSQSPLQATHFDSSKSHHLVPEFRVGKPLPPQLQTKAPSASADMTLSTKYPTPFRLLRPLNDPRGGVFRLDPSAEMVESEPSGRTTPRAVRPC